MPKLKEKSGLTPGQAAALDGVTLPSGPIRRANAITSDWSWVTWGDYRSYQFDIRSYMMRHINNYGLSVPASWPSAVYSFAGTEVQRAETESAEIDSTRPSV